jgi:hypothetical protein
MDISYQPNNSLPNKRRTIFRFIKWSAGIALVFFLGYYSPHSNAFSSRADLFASVVYAILVGIFSFVISFVCSRLIYLDDYLNKMSKQDLEKFEPTPPSSYDPNSIEEITRHPQPFSYDAYYDYWRQSENHPCDPIRREP